MTTKRRKLKIWKCSLLLKSDEEKQRNKAYNDLFSTVVSKVRQPIESFFNWLNEKTKIQRANKVRSTSGLLVHTMGKIAVAFIYLIFKYLYLTNLSSGMELYEGLSNYFELYNGQRLHQSLNYCTPAVVFGRHKEFVISLPHGAGR